MSWITKMLLLGGDESGFRPRDDYRDAEIRHDGPQSWEYAPEDRFRDRRGREHYDDGRFAPMDDGRMWVDSRHYSPQSHYPPPMTPYVPPVYERNVWETRGEYARPRYDSHPYGRYPGDRSEYPMDKIGFAMEGEVGRPAEFEAHHMDHHMSGHASSGEYPPLTREKAEKWVAGMKNADGSPSPRWPLEQTKQIQSQRGIGLDPIKFWVTMNMMFSDYATVAEKAGVSTTDFYADMAKAFLTDKDAQPDKLDRYYCAIAGR